MSPDLPNELYDEPNELYDEPNEFEEDPVLFLGALRDDVLPELLP